MKYIFLTFLTICGLEAFSQTALVSKRTFNLSLSTIIEEPIATEFDSQRMRIRPGLGKTFISSNLFSHEISIREL